MLRAQLLVHLLLYRVICDSSSDNLTLLARRFDWDEITRQREISENTEALVCVLSLFLKVVLYRIDTVPPKLVLEIHSNSEILHYV